MSPEQVLGSPLDPAIRSSFHSARSCTRSPPAAAIRFSRPRPVRHDGRRSCAIPADECTRDARRRSSASVRSIHRHARRRPVRSGIQTTAELTAISKLLPRRLACVVTPRIDRPTVPARSQQSARRSSRRDAELDRAHAGPRPHAARTRRPSSCSAANRASARRRLAREAHAPRSRQRGCLVPDRPVLRARRARRRSCPFVESSNSRYGIFAAGRPCRRWRSRRPRSQRWRPALRRVLPRHSTAARRARRSAAPPDVRRLSEYVQPRHTEVRGSCCCSTICTGPTSRALQLLLHLAPHLARCALLVDRHLPGCGTGY